MTPADQLAHAAAVACDLLGSRLHAEPGWRDRGHGITPVDWRAVLLHDTVTPPSWSRSQLTRLLRDGYTGLPGPIANVQLDRDGSATLIAAGRAYHAGPGSDPLGLNIQAGNLHTIGVEAANAGAVAGEPWTDLQRDWTVVFCAALQLTPIGHHEWAPARKVDPWSLGMRPLRQTVSAFTMPDLPDDLEPMEDVMADPEIARALHRLADAAEVRAQADTAREVAAMRTRAGRPDDVASDGVWIRRVAVDRSHGLADAADALAG